METIVTILIFAFVGIYALYAFKQIRTKEDEPQLPELDAINENETMQNTTFLQSMHYADKKQDSRTDAIMKELGAIHFWVMILGIYALIKLIEEIVKIVILVGAGYQTAELLKIIF